LGFTIPSRGTTSHYALLGDILLTQKRTQSICSTYGSRILDNFYRSTLAHLAENSSSISQHLPTSILKMSTSYQSTPVSRTNGKEESDRWERRTIMLNSKTPHSPQAVFESLVKGKSELGEVWLESARVRLCSPHMTLIEADLNSQTANWSSTILSPLQPRIYTLLSHLDSHAYSSIQLDSHERKNRNFIAFINDLRPPLLCSIETSILDNYHSIPSAFHTSRIRRLHQLRNEGRDDASQYTYDSSTFRRKSKG